MLILAFQAELQIEVAGEGDEAPASQNSSSGAACMLHDPLTRVQPRRGIPVSPRQC